MLIMILFKIYCNIVAILYSLNMESQHDCNLSINTKKVIIFTHKSKNYSFLSSMYQSDIVVDSKRYYHVEGYYQSQKCSNINSIAEERIRNIYSPIVSIKVASQYIMDDDRRREWNNTIGFIIMKKGTLIKFVTNSELLNLLLSTKDSILIEGSIDEYWGRGKDGNGKNTAGQILMEVRNIINSISILPS